MCIVGDFVLLCIDSIPKVIGIGKIGIGIVGCLLAIIGIYAVAARCFAQSIIVCCRTIGYNGLRAAIFGLGNAIAIART